MSRGAEAYFGRFASEFCLVYCYPFSLLSSRWFVIAVCGSVSVQETS